MLIAYFCQHKLYIMTYKQLPLLTSSRMYRVSFL